MSLSRRSTPQISDVGDDRAHYQHLAAVLSDAESERGVGGWYRDDGAMHEVQADADECQEEEQDQEAS